MSDVSKVRATAITVNLTEEEYQQLRLLAERAGRSRSDWARRAILSAMEKEA